MADERFIVFSSPVAGREQEYQDWYVQRHIDEIIALPGVVDGRFYKALDARGLPGSHVGIYRLNVGSAEHALAEIARLRDSGVMSSCGALDRTKGSTFLIGKAIGPVVRAAGAAVKAEDVATGSLMVLANAVAGAEAEYDSFVDRQHVHNVLRIPGMIAGQCFALRDRRGASDWQFAALYAFNATPEAIFAEMTRPDGIDAMPQNPSDRAHRLIAVFGALGPSRRAVPFDGR